MNYYDLNAKFVHKFSDRDKLTAVVYWGKDVSDASPSDSYKIYKGDDNDNSDYLLIKHSTINHWDNVMGSAYWTHLFNNSFFFKCQMSTLTLVIIYIISNYLH